MTSQRPRTTARRRQRHPESPPSPLKGACINARVPRPPIGLRYALPSSNRIAFHGQLSRNSAAARGLMLRAASSWERPIGRLETWLCPRNIGHQLPQAQLANGSVHAHTKTDPHLATAAGSAGLLSSSSKMQAMSRANATVTPRVGGNHEQFPNPANAMPRAAHAIPNMPQLMKRQSTGYARLRINARASETRKRSVEPVTARTLHAFHTQLHAYPIINRKSGNQDVIIVKTSRAQSVYPSVVRATWGKETE